MSDVNSRQLGNLRSRTLGPGAPRRAPKRNSVAAPLCTLLYPARGLDVVQAIMQEEEATE